jgi:hypothetical protein
MTDAFVGIDVSESVSHSQSINVITTSSALSVHPPPAKLINELQSLRPQLVAFAATRHGAEIHLAAAVHAAGLPALVVNERTLQRFARRENLKADTAHLLAAFAGAQGQRTTNLSPDPAEFQSLLERRSQLVEMLDAERAREQTCPPAHRREVAAHVFSIEKRIAAIDLQLKKLLRETGVWRVESAATQTAAPLVLTAFAIFTAAVLLVLPLWIVKYPPLLDYPNHLARVFILTHINNPNYQFSLYYTATLGPYPYLAMDLLLMGLQKFFGIFTGGRLILSLCVLGVPIGAWFFVRQANRDNTSLACWGLLSGYNIFFLWGFVNWQLSMALVLIVTGLWIRYLARPTIWRRLALLLIVTALYFTHLQGFGLAGLVVTAYATLAVPGWRRVLLALAQGWALFLPGGCLHLLTRVTTRETNAAWAMNFHPLSDKWQRLYFFMQGYSPNLDAVTLLVLIACAIGAWWRNPRIQVESPLAGDHCRRVSFVLGVSGIRRQLGRR